MQTLEEINNALERTLEELEIKIPELDKFEIDYYGKYNRYLLSSPLKTATDREAESQVRLEEGGLKESHAQIRGEVKLLLIRKEVLIEMSRNMRSLNLQNKNKEQGGELPF